VGNNEDIDVELAEKLSHYKSSMDCVFGAILLLSNYPVRPAIVSPVGNYYGDTSRPMGHRKKTIFTGGDEWAGPVDVSPDVSHRSANGYGTPIEHPQGQTPLDQYTHSPWYLDILAYFTNPSSIRHWPGLRKKRVIRAVVKYRVVGDTLRYVERDDSLALCVWSLRCRTLCSGLTMRTAISPSRSQ